MIPRARASEIVWLFAELLAVAERLKTLADSDKTLGELLADEPPWREEEENGLDTLFGRASAVLQREERALHMLRPCSVCGELFVFDRDRPSTYCCDTCRYAAIEGE